MAQNQNRTAKQHARAERRAAQEAQEQAIAEQAAKERKQQTLIGIIVVVVVVALVAVIGFVVYRNVSSSIAEKNTTADQAYEKLQQVATKPAKANDKGGIVLSKNGYDKKIDGVPTISIYMDPLCPGCASFDRQSESTLKALTDAGQINLEVYPLAFLDENSTDKYSSRVSGSINYIADHDDDVNHLLNYLTNIYAESFQPGEGSNYKSVSNEQLQEQAVKAGVPESIASKAFGGEFQDWIDALSSYTPKREELWNTSGTYKGSMTTPTVTFNGKILDMTAMSSQGLTYPQALLTSIGLEESQVGKTGELPSIGEGDPLSLS